MKNYSSKISVLMFSVIIISLTLFTLMIYRTQTEQAKATMTADALEFLYQKGLGYMNLSRWQDAKATLEAVFEIDPNYKDVQARLIEIETEIKRLGLTSITTPIASPTLENIYPSDYKTLELNIELQDPVMPINLPANPSSLSQIAGDLAWNQPTFASSYWQVGYPSGATSGKSWTCAGSTNSWFYVDLGKPKDIHQIVTTLFVDARFSKAPRTAYIVSNDLKTWQVVIEETNYENSSHRGQPRVLTLPEDVEARYVGLYATGWDGGWADLNVFVVLPPDQPFQE